MKYYLIAGEASGDLHGSLLMQALRQQDGGAEFRFWGGDNMQQQGGVLVKHYRDLSFMGIWEVIKNIRTIVKNLSFCKQDILSFRPDVLLLIDYPGFNLRMAHYAHRHGIKVFYYISPKIWAWKESRIHSIKTNVNEMFVIFPFEEKFYQRHNYPVHYIGNPLVSLVEKKKKEITEKQKFFLTHCLNDKPIVAILPGSRKQEIAHILPEVAQIIAHFPEYQFVVSAISAIEENFYRNFLPFDITLVYDDMYSLLSYAEAAIVTSGTAVLETALLGVPQVAVYKISTFSYAVAKYFIKVKYITLPNLILDAPVVKEVIQHNLAAETADELHKILNNAGYRKSIKDEYARLRELLGDTEAALRAAIIIVQKLKTK